MPLEVRASTTTILNRPPPPIAAPASVAAPSAIPNVRAIIDRHSDPIERNEAFNVAYRTFALAIQQVLTPQPTDGSIRGIGRATRSTSAPIADTIPNWFAVGAHASPQVGRSMVAADRTIEALASLADARGGHDRAALFDRLDLRGESLALASRVASALERFGANESAATAVACAVTLFTSVDDATATVGIVADPRLATAVAYRIWNLVAAGAPGQSTLGRIFDAPAFVFDAFRGLFGGDPRTSAILEATTTLCRTYRALLEEGNRDIFADIGGSAEAFLRLREAGRASRPEDVLGNLALPESTAAGSRRIHERALADLAAGRSTDPRSLAAPGAGNDRVRAAFALYVSAGRTADPARRDALVRIANDLVAWREQAEIVQRAFTATKPGELDRPAVIGAITPAIQVPIGELRWTLVDFAARRGDRDGNPLTAPASELDWSSFEERWPAILDGFDVAYANRPQVWRFGDPHVR